MVRGWDKLAESTHSRQSTVEYNMAKQTVGVQEVTHAEVQKKETFGEDVIVPGALGPGAGALASIPKDTDLDHVVTIPDLSTTAGHRIQVQGVDAPSPAVNSLQAPEITPEFVNGVPPSKEQVYASMATTYDVDGNLVRDKKKQA